MADTVEEVLMKYVEECYVMDNQMSLADIQAVLARARGKPLQWNLRSEDGFPILHIAAMNESTPAQELGAILSTLLAHGAPPDATDEDGDDVLKAVMMLSEDLDRPGGDEDQDKDDILAMKMLHVASVCALLSCPAYHIDEAAVFRITSWLRHYIPDDVHPGVLKVLQFRAGEELVAQAKSSEDLLKYLEECAYDDSAGVDARRVKDLVAQGARPDHTQNGASALLLAVLNPFSKLEDLQEIFKVMIQARPRVAGLRDGFGLSALSWASDYENIASQNNLKIPNPASLLALMPLLVELLPDEVDAGVQCHKVHRAGQCAREPPSGAPSLRFLEGERVLCRVEVPGGKMDWEEGFVRGLWYRDTCWPKRHPGAPYEVQLDIGNRVFALVDHDRIIRRESDKVKDKALKPVAGKATGKGAFAAPSAGAAGDGKGGGYPQAKAKPAAGPRFKKQQCADGSWEMLDTVSGKARPCPPPDSDSD